MKKFALITGASSGIGKELAIQCLKNDYNVVIVSEKEKELANAAEEMQTISSTMQVMPLVKDLTKENSPEEIFSQMEKNGIAIDLLINNAGVGQKGSFDEIPLEKDLYLIQLNIEALTKLTKLFLRPMLKRGAGKILNAGSIAGFQPGPLLAVYHATKAYVVSLSEALAEELKDTGVTVTCLCPGPTETNFFERAYMEDSRVVVYGDQTMMDAKTVAEGGFKAMQDGERIYVPGLTNKTLTFLRRVMPIAVQAKLNKKFYESVEE